MAAVEEAKVTEESTTSSIMNALKSAATTGMAKIAELDEKHGISEKAKAGIEAGMQKAGELDEKHGISEKVKGAADVAIAKAKEVDGKYGISETATATLKAGMEKAKEVDGKYGVSETITAKVKEVDEKYEVSQKIKKADESLGVTETVKKTAAIVSDKIGSLRNMIGYSCKSAFLGDMEVSLSLSGNVLTITPKAEDGLVQSVQITTEFPVVIVGETIVTIGEQCITFGTMEEAATFLNALEKARPKPAEETVFTKVSVDEVGVEIELAAN